MKRFVLLGLLAACAPDPKIPSRPNAASLFYSNVELAPGRRFPSPLVRGTVNGKETVLIVDTGAQVSVIDAKLAAEANLALLRGAGEARDPSGNGVPMMKTDTPVIAVDGLGPLPNRMTAIVELPEPFRRIGIGGILSPQMLAGEHQVVLDLPRHELRLDDPAAASKVSERVFDVGAIQVCRYADGGFGAASLIAEASIDGVPVRIELDTGASNTFVVADSAVGRKLAERTDGERKKSLTAAGEVETARFESVAAKLGEFDITGPLMMMPGKRAGACGYEGRIGIDRLRTCTLVIGAGDARATCRKSSD